MVALEIVVLSERVRLPLATPPITSGIFFRSLFSKICYNKIMKNKKVEQMIRGIMAYNFMLFILIFLFVFFAVGRPSMVTGVPDLEIEDIAASLKHWRTALAAWGVLNILFAAHVWYDLHKKAKPVKRKERDEIDISVKQKSDKWGMS